MLDGWYGPVPYGVRTTGMENDRWAHIGGVGSWVLWSRGCGLSVTNKKALAKQPETCCVEGGGIVRIKGMFRG